MFDAPIMIIQCMLGLAGVMIAGMIALEVRSRLVKVKYEDE